MALIQQLQRVSKERQSVHGSVPAALSVFTDENGAKYVQIDTYGSPERANAGQVNQSIQFGRQVALELSQIIDQLYPQAK